MKFCYNWDKTVADLSLTMTRPLILLADKCEEVGASPFQYLLPSADTSWKEAYKKRDAKGVIVALSRRLDVWSKASRGICPDLILEFRQTINATLRYSDRLDKMRQIAEVMDKTEVNMLKELLPAFNAANINALLLIAEEQEQRVRELSEALAQEKRAASVREQQETAAANLKNVGTNATDDDFLTSVAKPEQVAFKPSMVEKSPATLPEDLATDTSSKCSDIQTVDPKMPRCPITQVSTERGHDDKVACMKALINAGTVEKSDTCWRWVYVREGCDRAMVAPA